MTIAVDFDGTIVEHAYPKIGKPIPFAIEVLKKLQQEERHTLILWSVREGKLLQEAIDYCRERGLEFYAANKNYPEEVLDEKTPRKLTADLWIDDRNVGGLPDWGIIYKIIKSGTNSYNGIDMVDVERQQTRKKNLFIRIGEAWERSKGYRY